MREHESAGGFGCGFVLANHAGDEGHFTSHVKVVGAVLGAGAEGRLAQASVGPDGSDDDQGLPGETGQLLGVAIGIGLVTDYLDGGRESVRVELGTFGRDGLELGLRTAGNGPTEVGREVGGDVLGRVLSGVAWGNMSVVLPVEWDG